MDKSLFILGEVVFVEGSRETPSSDDLSAMRIKVRVDTDKGISVGDLPYAFPMLPKVFHVVPKLGEGVLVLNSELGNFKSQRYYIGPVISQPQFMERSVYNGGRGNAVSLLSTRKTDCEEPLDGINREPDVTNGSYPRVEDVAVLGRGQEDIILKYKANDRKYNETSEVDIRAGIKLKPSDSSVKFIKGNVVFNESNPGYIQVKFRKNGLSGLKDGTGDLIPMKYEDKEVRQGSSIVNVVADKINLISHKDSNHFGTAICDRESLVDENKIDEIMSMLHRSVYGDELVELLKLIVKALREHTHPFPMKPPVLVGTDIEQIGRIDEDYYERLLSPNVRIS
jgi:hypothetical protein